VLVRCLDFSGNEISAENLPTPLRLAVKRVELLKLPIFPNAWPKNPARDVSSVMLNELFHVGITSMEDWNGEIQIGGGRIDFGHYSRSKLDHAMEIEIGGASRLDSDILKLSLIKQEIPTATLSLVVPSRAIKKRCHTGKCAEEVIVRLKELEPVLDNVRDIIVVEFDVPPKGIAGYRKHLVNGKSKFPKEKKLFIKGATKKDARGFIEKKRKLFFF
jgi:hypothetical protein|tara:strand:+ start:458 stop:1108 length:651 start_codon:yes stop_codon:yes gene_type:complete